jgi:GNAT superfamily N-acetyltransferase
VTAIRAASLQDADAIAELHVAAWRWAYRGLMADDVLDALSLEERATQWRSTLAEARAQKATFVAERGGRIVGFTSVGRSVDAEASPETGEVYAIYLDEAVLATGVGRDLFARANTSLRELGFGRATLWVLEANDRARWFYEKAGWTWDGTTSMHDDECANLPIVRYAVDL